MRDIKPFIKINNGLLKNVVFKNAYVSHKAFCWHVYVLYSLVVYLFLLLLLYWVHMW
jgi:uncharacterized membrane protein YdbT with pleckstrin-like domain